MYKRENWQLLPEMCTPAGMQSIAFIAECDTGDDEFDVAKGETLCAPRYEALHVEDEECTSVGFSEYPNAECAVQTPYPDSNIAARTTDLASSVDSDDEPS
ncbi:hypothetical protein MTO96_030222 [Rhipicephalus appendiculatus]